MRRVAAQSKDAFRFIHRQVPHVIAALKPREIGHLQKALQASAHFAQLQSSQAADHHERWRLEQRERASRGDWGAEDGEKRLMNVYHDLFVAFLELPGLHPSPLRGFCAEKFSFSVPSWAALSRLSARFLSIVEVGAGTGYWSSLLRSLGSDVIAVDACTEAEHRWTIQYGRWHPVRHKQGSQLFSKPAGLLPATATAAPVAVRESEPNELHSRALLYCWPRGSPPPGLDGYRGQHVVLVGCDDAEGVGGIMATGEWEVEERMSLPQWPDIGDGVWTFKRKGTG
ncbi:unnamed protein product [Vitrella brassicaformis CCMP3155]|uniref:Uncharacterized protein n=2 Tax=Vitrella brassicaformis TaxID=1169539 RepID=A0A0G4F1N0_VITBC|nr:unnamed protein product [Vitrella brassicaformis CCMP3155]|eukprot:CEM05295.1 unnamed protein product [Vitrella brassicaformis CCMP3155]